MYGEFLPNAEGEDVVAGIRNPKKLSELEQELPSVFQSLIHIEHTLEKHYRDMQVFFVSIKVHDSYFILYLT